MSWEWEVGISTGIAYERPIGEVIGPLARAGFRAVEISTAPHHLDVRDRAAVASAADALRSEGLRVVSLHAPFGSDLNFTAPDADQRRRTLDVMTHAADALVRFGGRPLRGAPRREDQRWTWDRDQRLGYAVEGLRHLWAACRERGLELVVESPLPHLLGAPPTISTGILQQLPAEGRESAPTRRTCRSADTFRPSSHASRRGSSHAPGERQRRDHRRPSSPGEAAWTGRRSCARFAPRATSGAFLLEVSCGGALEDRARRAAASQARLPSWSALT
jgi:hypothetical protein